MIKLAYTSMKLFITKECVVVRKNPGWLQKCSLPGFALFKGCVNIVNQVFLRGVFA
jgi:hypothetical protein